MSCFLATTTINTSQKTFEFLATRIWSFQCRSNAIYYWYCEFLFHKYRFNCSTLHPAITV